MVREGARTLAGRQAASRLAAGILRGARDRSREEQPAVEDQQRRVVPLREARPATRRGKLRSDSGRTKSKRAA